MHAILSFPKLGARPNDPQRHFNATCGLPIQIVDAKNQAERQPMLNLQLAKAYLTGTDAEMPKRTWQHALEVITETKRGANKKRLKRIAKDRALSLLWPRVIVETEAELFLKVLRIGTVSTNVYLRRLYNFCVDMNWLPWPIVPKRQWPIVRFHEKRAITWEEHCRIVEREKKLRSLLSGFPMDS